VVPGRRSAIRRAVAVGTTKLSRPWISGAGRAFPLVPAKLAELPQPGHGRLLGELRGHGREDPALSVAAGEPACVVEGDVVVARADPPHDHLPVAATYDDRNCRTSE
jgi:hypothetical protein